MIIHHCRKNCVSRYTGRVLNRNLVILYITSLRCSDVEPRCMSALVGDYSCLQASFELKRQIGFFILQTYVPSMLIVMLSWVGFWINKDSEPARIALGVTTVLTMTTQLTTSRSNTMRVSYLKAIDVWYSSCMLFVFSALIEFAFVNASSRREKKALERAKKFDDVVSNSHSDTVNAIMSIVHLYSAESYSISTALSALSNG